MSVMKILIVDDEPLLCEMLTRGLRRAGFMVETARDGLDAIDALKDFDADLAFIDILMPRQEGLQTVHQLRRENSHVRIVAMSGGGSLSPSDHLDAAKQLGADLTVRKPFTAATAINIAHSLLDNKDQTGPRPLLRSV